MQLKQTGLTLLTRHHSDLYLIYISLKFPDSIWPKGVSKWSVENIPAEIVWQGHSVFCVDGNFGSQMGLASK